MTTIAIDLVPSLAIRVAARAAGIIDAERLGVHEHPDHPGSADWRIRLYRVGDTLVAATNGDPVWQDDSESWTALMAEYSTVRVVRNDP